MPGKINKKILFVSHKSNRSGAPLLLLDIIKEFKKHSVIPFQILAMEDGELIEDFRRLGKTFIWNTKVGKSSTTSRVTSFSIVSRVLFVLRGLYIFYCLKSTTLIFFNTIANGLMHKKLLFLKSKNICYVHELEASVHMLTNKKSLDIILNHTAIFLTVSESVKKNLAINHSVDEKIIHVLKTPFQSTKHKDDYGDFTIAFREKNNIPDDYIIIGCVGQNEWRKGFSLFVPLVKLYFNLFPDSKVFFIWKGFNINNASSFFDLYDFKKSNVHHNSLILPYGHDSIETMACFDVHLLLSREDPYPLVMLEAASLGIPTACFLDSGGASEFVEQEIGFCAEYGNLLEMATGLNILSKDIVRMKSMGISAQTKIKEHSYDRTMPPFVHILEDDLYQN